MFVLTARQSNKTHAIAAVELETGQASGQVSACVDIDAVS
jgi:hypothetical protein